MEKAGVIMEHYFGFAKELLDKGIATVQQPYGENNLYDLTIQFKDDLDFYLELAGSVTGKVLDIGCGTGRLLLPLLKQGTDVVGLDNSKHMLKIAKDKCQAYGYSPDLVQGDMRDFSFAEKFDLIIIPYHSMIYMINDEDRKAVFQCVYNHLTPEGIFAFDFDTTQVKVGKSFPWLGLQGVHPFTNEVITQVVQQNGITPNLRVLNQINYYFGEKPRVTVEYSIESSVTAQHMQDLLEQNGFKVIGMYSNYEREGYHDQGECIVIANK